jgi:hypothetical protein
MNEKVDDNCSQPIRTVYTKNGLPHYASGPAMTWDDSLTVDDYWFLHGNYHRYYGPAVNTNVKRAWFIHGVIRK